MKAADKIVCPHCGQDWVVLAKVKPLDLLIQLCPECDACWQTDEPIIEETFTDLDVFMESKGFADNSWKLLEFVDG